jgi:hypothetical protein
LNGLQDRAHFVHGSWQSVTGVFPCDLPPGARPVDESGSATCSCGFLTKAASAKIDKPGTRPGITGWRLA